MRHQFLGRCDAVLMGAAMGVTGAAISMIAFAPISAADPTQQLKIEIDAARAESGCPPFEVDPVLADLSQRSVHEVGDYVKHTGRFLPTSSDRDLLRVLRETGYNTVNAKQLNGYADYRTGGAGDNETRAIKGAVLQGHGFGTLTDCTLTKYGFSGLNDDGSGGWPSTVPRAYSVVVVILAGPSGR